MLLHLLKIIRHPSYRTSILLNMKLSETEEIEKLLHLFSIFMMFLHRNGQLSSESTGCIYLPIKDYNFSLDKQISI